MCFGPDPDLREVIIKNYFHLPFKPNVSLTLILKRFKMLDILKYDRIIDPQKYIKVFAIGINIIDLLPYEVKSMMLKNFDQMLTKEALA